MYSKETIRISRLAEIQPFFMIGLNSTPFHDLLKFHPFSWLAEKIELRKGLIICREEKVGSIEFCSITQNAELFVSLL